MNKWDPFSEKIVTITEINGFEVDNNDLSETEKVGPTYV